MSNKYPYIATNGLNNFLIYAENTATLIGDESNCFSSGFKIVVGEDTLKNITREYLENTYGKVESKEYAEFISKLAMSAGFGFPFNKVKSNGYFSVSGGNIYFWGSENVASSLNEKLITIPLPPKEPESKSKLSTELTVYVLARLNLRCLKMRKYREFLIIATLCVSAGCAAMYFLYTLINR